MNEVCFNCVYCHLGTLGSNEYRTCHRYPQPNTQGWCEVKSTDWCGEFRPTADAIKAAHAAAAAE